MLPIVLEIKNFLAYCAPDAVRFDGIHLACLTGHNGAGKSSLLDAMTWVLWGKARARRDEELIHLGEQEMYVRLDFEQENALYRVVRHRSRKRGGEGRLDLFVVHPDGTLETRSEPSIRATQERINTLLRLDYETFIHSAFLQQGKADAFTLKPPAQRKQILADILGLAQWERYEETTKERLKTVQSDLKVIKSRIEDIDKELQREPSLKANLERDIAAHIEAQTMLAAAEVRLAEVEHAPRELDNLRARQAEGEGRIRSYRKDLDSVHAEITQKEQRIAEYQSDLNEHEAIEAGYQQLQAAREADSALGDKLRLLREIDEQRHDAERQIDTERARLENEVSAYEARISELQRTVDQADEGALTQVSEEVNALQELETQRETMLERIGQLETHCAELQAANTTMTPEGKRLRERVETLEKAEGALCPLCGQPLDEDHRHKLIDELSGELAIHRSQYRENQENIAKAKSEIAEFKAEVERFEEELKRLRPLIEQAGKLQAQYDAAQKATTALEEAYAQLQTVENTLATGGYAHEWRALLAHLESQRKELGYDPSSHDAARQQIQQFRDYEVRYNRLQLAVSALPDLQVSLEVSQRRRENVEKAIHKEQTQIDALASEILRLQELVKEYQLRQNEVNRLRSDERRAHERVIVARQELEALATQRARRESLETEHANKMHQEGLLEELKKAFGKNGVPAMIIETALPELEASANDILTRMTDGRMNLRLTTQKEKITGGVAETLDIEIADELGTRSYEMFSGGEAFRINFALRVALSQLLARRAGAHLRTLFIDEGFGTQDEDGRNKLVEAINAIQNEFDMVLIITHLEDLRDSFPVHIVVEKTPHGSRVSVR
jgi:exonuclease SbcC